MATIPGIRFNITGASGSQGLLTPESSWRCYVFPRGAWAAQASAGTLITFDTAAVAARFAANKWIQVGINPANLRKVSAVGGNSISVSGSAVTVASDDRIFIIGSTQPTVSGSSATYLNPDSTIYDRDDDSSNRQTNSMITSDSNGQIGFYAPFGLYDCLVQDGNRTVQGYIADLSLGMAEGVSTIYASVFGATVTINANVGITGSLTVTGAETVTGNLAVGGAGSVQGNLTVTGLLDQTGRAKFGDTATFNTNAGFTGYVTFGSTVTMNANAGVTGTLTVGQTLTLQGRISGTTGAFTGAMGVSSDLSCRRLLEPYGTTATSANFVLSAGWGASASITLVNPCRDGRGMVTVTALGSGIGASPTISYSFVDGAYAAVPFIVAQRHTNGLITSGKETFTTFTGLSGVTFTYQATPASGDNVGLAWITVG